MISGGGQSLEGEMDKAHEVINLMITSSVQLISSRLIFKRRLESLIHHVFIADKTTLRSSVLAALSSVIAQLITSYRKGRVLSRSSVDFIPVIQFAIYSSISSPLNRQWSVFAPATVNLCLIGLRQFFLESLLPGQSPQPPKALGV